MSEKKEYVSERKLTTWFLGALLSLMALLLTISGMAFASASTITKDVGEIRLSISEDIDEVEDEVNSVGRSLAVHIAAQVESDKAMLRTLQLLEDALRENSQQIEAQRNEQREFLEKILGDHIR